MLILYIIIGILCGVIVLLCCKLRKKKKLDYNEVKKLQADIEQLQEQKNLISQHIQQREDSALQEIKKTEKVLQELHSNIDQFKKAKEDREFEYNQVNIEYLQLLTKKQETIKNIEDLKKQQQNIIEELYKTTKTSAEQAFDKELDNIYETLAQSRQEAQSIYLAELESCKTEFQTAIAAKQQELIQVETELAKLKQLVTIATEEHKRAFEIKNKTEFYKLQLSQEDIMEITKIREILPFLKEKEPLNKVIYKVYYEKPFTALAGRVIGEGKHTGIYKITNLKNGMCYVGQAVDIRERWRQHIKRGVGADTPTRNKLYPAMLEDGVENFSFEIIEECSENQLNEKEQYWQNFFESKTWGYSIK